MSKTNIVVRNVNEELKRKFKAKVASEGTNMTDKAEQLIIEYVNDSKRSGILDETED